MGVFGRQAIMARKRHSAEQITAFRTAAPILAARRTAGPPPQPPRLAEEVDQDTFARKHTELRERVASIKL